MRRFLIICGVFTFIYACAFDIVHVKQLPTSFEPTDTPSNSFELEEEVNFRLGAGYDRTLKAKTKWDPVGTITHGDVFKSKDQVLTVEASNIHEAYLVVSSSKLVGFYLPVEKTFSPLSNPISLKLKPVPSD